MSNRKYSYIFSAVLSSGNIPSQSLTGLYNLQKTQVWSIVTMCLYLYYILFFIFIFIYICKLLLQVLKYYKHSSSRIVKLTVQNYSLHVLIQ